LAWHGIPEFSDDVFMSPNAPKHMPRIGDVVGFVEVKESQACCAAARWLQREWIYKLRRISCSFLPYILPQASHFFSKNEKKTFMGVLAPKTANIPLHVLLPPFSCLFKSFERYRK
jgi:hypothetical protein